jgi:predicted secreted protein
MEIIIVLVAFVLFALLIMAMRNPSQTVQEPVPETVPEAPYKIETPAA